jgi:HSP20 family protein
MQPGSALGFGLPRWRELFERGPFRDLQRTVPAIDVYEEKDAIVVKAEVSGMTKDDVQVSMSGDVVTIRGEKKQEEDVRDGEYYRHERSYGAFSRSVRLPTDVQADKATATFKNGVLELRLPKSEEAKRKSVSIPVK